MDFNIFFLPPHPLAHSRDNHDAKPHLLLTPNNTSSSFFSFRTKIPNLNYK